MSEPYYLAIPSYGGIARAVVMQLAFLAKELPPAHFQLVEGSLITLSRNTIARDFLLSPYDRLLMIDNDILFDASHVARLLSHDVPIVAGLCALKAPGKLQWVYGAIPSQKQGKGDSPLTDCYWVGTGFISIKREVFVSLIEKGLAPEYRCDPAGNPAPAGKSTTGHSNDFFSVGVVNGTYLTEDQGLCLKARAAGCRVFADTSIKLAHLGLARYPLTEIPFGEGQHTRSRDP